MAIRIRVVNGVTVALCAARSVPKEGDIYLDDNIHYALSVKFMRDYADINADINGVSPVEPSFDEYYAIIDAEESNNDNRTLWDMVWALRALT